MHIKYLDIFYQSNNYLLVDLYFIIIENLLRVLSVYMKDMKILFYLTIVFF